ncbi:unnamed protein product [Linum tenue]|uniref:Uncharacterized protein n=1 Tax=Linum tenue TaxID=586396 RepID=A0AAV0JL87_9ROSI|nr:unnamed protein product [Linum tenue]
MAVSAFKSTSRRGPTRPSPTSSSLSDKESKSAGNAKTAPPPPPALRRSRSVSAVARNPRGVDTSSSTSTSPYSSSASDFLITRENPLYWSDKEKPKDAAAEQDFPILASSKSLKEPTPKPRAPPESDTRRGRSISRTADAMKTSAPANGKLIPRQRSPSRVDIGRRNRARSVSRAPTSRSYGSLNSESDVEVRRSLPTVRRNGNDASGVVSGGRSNGSERRSADWQIQSDGSATTVPPSPSYSWEDAALGGSSSDAEERTIKAVCEQMKAFQVDNLEGDASGRIYETVRSEVRRAIADIQGDLATAIGRNAVATAGVADVTDIPPDLVNPSAVELVLDIRREYTTKLEQSHERAMKLRADLAVEEHRGSELSRILKEVLPDPKSSNERKPRVGRKSSIERRKMSKRLTEEAMAYFDECVSLSTFDSSDFSSQDDPPMRFVGTHVADRSPFSPATPSMTADSELLKSESNNIKEPASMRRASGLSATSSDELAAAGEASISSSQTESARSFQFSFSRKSDNKLDIQQDIGKYTKHFGKDIERAADSQSSVSNSYGYDIEEYNQQSSQQSMLFDSVFFRSRIESGSMLLCGGGLGVLF